MKHLKIFEELGGILTGWRGQNSKTFIPTTGENATEGEGYYLFENEEDSKGWGKYIFEVKYKEPKNPIRIEYLGPENSFLFWGEGEEIYEPIKSTDSEWIKLHKRALAIGGDDLSKCIKELTKLLIESGYDAVIIDDLPYWTILLDPSLIISTSRSDDKTYKPFKAK